MSQTEIETRIAALERELRSVKTALAKLEQKGNGKKKSWLDDHVGIFANDPLHEEAMRLGREWRKEQREEYDKD